MNRHCAVLLMIACAALGCAAYHFPEGNAAGLGSTVPASAPTGLVLGVEEPDIRLDDKPLIPAAGPDARTSERDIEQAVHTIDALRGTGLFSEVNFVKQLSRPADITVRIEPAPPNTGDADAVLPFVFTAGVFPLIFTEQGGVYFSLVDRPDRANLFRFDWPITAVAGWAAPFLLMLPKWRIERDQELFHASLAAYLVSRGADLWGPSSSEVGRPTSR